MKRIVMLLAVLFAACAPQDSDIGASEGSAGSVGVAAEPLTCASDSTVCSQMKSAAASWMGGSWSWSGACTPFAIWNGTGSGGRTVHSVQDINSGSLNQRGFDPSQGSHFYVRCKCNSNGAYTGCTASSN